MDTMIMIMLILTIDDYNDKDDDDDDGLSMMIIHSDIRKIVIRAPGPM